MIRSLTVIHHRLIVGVLSDRGLSLHKIAEAAAVSIVELRRLQEFASPLGEEEAERLLNFARSVNVPRPVPVRKPVRKRKRWVRPVSQVSMTPEVIGQDAPGA